MPSIVEKIQGEVKARQQEIMVEATRAIIREEVKGRGSRITVRELFEIVNQKEVKTRVADMKVAELLGLGGVRGEKPGRSDGGRTRLTKQQLGTLSLHIAETIVRKTPAGLAIGQIVEKCQELSFPVDTTKVRGVLGKLVNTKKLKKKGELKNTVYLPVAS